MQSRNKVLLTGTQSIWVLNTTKPPPCTPPPPQTHTHMCLACRSTRIPHKSTTLYVMLLGFQWTAYTCYFEAALCVCTLETECPPPHTHNKTLSPNPTIA